jgi:hypothetical protein
VGKSPFLRMLAETLFDQKSYAFIRSSDLNGGFGLQGTETVEAVILDEADPEEPNFCQKLKELMGPGTVRVDRKYRAAEEVSFRYKVFLLGSNHNPERLWGADREAMDKRFPLQLELDRRLLSGETPDGCDLDALREEMGEVVVYALFFSSPEMEKDLNALLKAAEQRRKKRRELDRRLRRPSGELERLGISRRRLTEEWALLRQQLEDSGQLQRGLHQFGEGHVPEEEITAEGGEVAAEEQLRRTPFLDWERSRWERDPETAPHDYSGGESSDGEGDEAEEEEEEEEKVEGTAMGNKVLTE